MKTRCQFYRHRKSRKCTGPDTSIVVFQKTDKPAIHKCYYCHDLMIPTAYYAIHDTETKVIEYFVLDQKISKEEYEDFEKADREISKMLEEHRDHMIKKEIKKEIKARRIKND